MSLPRRSLVDVLEGYFLCHAVAFLHREAALEGLDEPVSGDEIAARAGVEPHRLAPLLDYLARRSDVLDAVDGGYRRGAGYDPTTLGFALDQYFGAYGPLASDLGRALSAKGGGALVDRGLHARAFARLERPSFPMLPQVMSSLGARRVLDLGCGAGALLVALARQDEAFVGWGVEASAAMCQAARERSAAAGVAGRVTILQGDAAGPLDWLPRSVVERVDAVTAVSLVNELFGDGTGHATGWLRGLRTAFPDRPLVVADYYGRLGHAADASQQVLLHDLVQALSGQGVPPPDREAWDTVYRTAGCRLLDSLEGGDGIPWLIHLIHLVQPGEEVEHGQGAEGA